MTETDVKKLTPGRKLDELVAEALSTLPYQYSTDIGAAMEALELIAGAKHWSWAVASQEGYDSGPLYYVSVQRGLKILVAEGDSRYTNEEEDLLDSLPLAICRAVLLTCAWKKEKGL